jgi:dTDP-4-amino-4,6-dideoxygalactose transaminase
VENKVTGREFPEKSVGHGAAGAPRLARAEANPNALALHGGTPVRSRPFPGWPYTDDVDERYILKSLNNRRWCQHDGEFIPEFEHTWKERVGSRGCVMTPCGTHALHMSLELLGVGPGDEVIVSPFTFVATIDVILLCYALPIFADTDLRTFQIDPDDIEHRITEHTRAILPVHIYGSAANMDKVLAIASKHSLPVVEDACQAHMSEWRGKKLGTLGTTGCFSFQQKKNLPGGEAGAMVSDDDDLIRRGYMFRDVGRPERGNSRYAIRGTTYCPSDFAAAVLMAQLEHFDEFCRRRETHGAYLREELKKIPGIAPQEHYAECTRSNYHVFGLRYDHSHFHGVARDKIVGALRAEGIPISIVYPPLNKMPYLEHNLSSRGFRTVFSEERLDKYRRQNHLPKNDELCSTGLWIPQEALLAEKSDVDNILEAIHKVQRNASRLV